MFYLVCNCLIVYVDINIFLNYLISANETAEIKNIIWNYNYILSQHHFLKTPFMYKGDLFLIVYDSNYDYS